MIEYRITTPADIDLLMGMDVRERIGRFKYVEESDIETEFGAISAVIDQEIEDVIERSED